MEDWKKTIQEQLDAIENRYQVRILLAVESGSRAWGFASPDSDYDVRFLYCRPREEYLRVDPQRDVIEWQLDEVLDINGWDLQKALLAFGKGNPNIMEWAHSPIVYRSSPEWEQIKPVIEDYFSEKSALCHYYGTANSTYRGFLMGEEIKYKKYFYALRPLLCCRWIERYHQAPPMDFRALLGLFDGGEEDLSPTLLEAIQILLERKAMTEERDLKPQMPVIIDFIRRECASQKQRSAAAPDDRKGDFTAINRVFRQTLGFA